MSKEEHEIWLTLSEIPEEAPDEANIVKVQLPLVGDTILVYNWDRSIHFESPITKNLTEIMDGALKKYFYYRIVKDKIELMGEAEWQEW